jgi:hypothetical protein
MKQATEKPPRDQAAQSLYIRAFEEFHTHGHSTIRCDRCGAVIQFRKLAHEAWHSSCECGKYNGDLKGL